MSIERIDTVGIVGAGVMGRRIAYACAAAGKRVRLYDIEPSQVKRALAAITAWLNQRELVALFAPIGKDELASCICDADLIIENAPERVEVKRAVFADIDAHAPPHAIIATNTSSIPGSWLADATHRPERVINVNFGHIEDPKVEVMGHPGTDRATVEQMTAFLRSIGMIPIVVRRESLGYATNRIWRAVKKEVLHLLDGGYTTPEDVDRGWMLDWGTPIGPCGLMDKVGLDVVRDIENIYYGASGDASDRPPPLLDAMIEKGDLGEKSGRGFYAYPSPAYQQEGFLTGKASEDDL